MAPKMPRTPFSTPLSRSARETKRRLEHIMCGPQKRPPAIFIALVSAFCLLSGNLVSCQVREEGPPQAEVWVDYQNSTELPWEDVLETQLPEYPGVTFRWTPYQVSAVEEGEERTLLHGMPVLAVFLWDFTGDGLRELCAVTNWGSGMIDQRVEAYDYAAGEVYMLRNRGMFDYGLSLGEGELQVTRSRYSGTRERGQLLSTGRLAIEEGTILLEGEERYKALGLAEEVPVLSDNPDLAYLLMREYHTYSSEADTRMNAYTLLTREGEGCTLALAKVDGGPHIAGQGNLMLGLWDQEEREWRGPVYTVGGDDGEFSSWTAEDGSLHILCANTMWYGGYAGSYTVGHYRFDGQNLTELDRWMGEDDYRLVPVEGGLEVYVLNPQYLLQHYNPEYNGVPLPEMWVYDRFEPVES
ncbi:hypothetical protein D1646_19930 [Pseudoflavonifractor sp. 60]|uniref:hypothetical protein n=1 Tax=Pseudoflavonifractor sp. 60 TaxID=2304576 RepID=UPI001371B6E6|nr:hypothetical protein [Pseudoflavonifractor sp. 60]NBI69010.1 hypothetical protein [Pseudoflavonifractor sp. 60]